MHTLTHTHTHLCTHTHAHAHTHMRTHTQTLAIANATFLEMLLTSKKQFRPKLFQMGFLVNYVIHSKCRIPHKFCHCNGSKKNCKRSIYPQGNPLVCPFTYKTVSSMNYTIFYRVSCLHYFITLLKETQDVIRDFFWSLPIFDTLRRNVIYLLSQRMLEVYEDLCLLVPSSISASTILWRL